MILVFIGLCALASLVVLTVDFRRLTVLSRCLLVLQLVLFCFFLVSVLNFSF